MIGWTSLIEKISNSIMDVAPPKRRRFEDTCHLGSGTYGDVYGAYDNLRKKKVAIKQFKDLTSATGGVCGHALREISVLRRVTDHKCIVNLLDVIEPSAYSSNNLFMVMEQEDCDLEKWMTDNRATRAEAAYILYQMLKACDYLHSNYIMHRDIKPDNVLINLTTLEVKLTDFGQARQFSLIPEKYTLQVQAMFYRAPELLLGCAFYDELVDVWSIGCVYAELLADGRPLFGTSDASAVSQIHCIFQKLGTPSAERWQNATKWPHFRNNFPQWNGKTLSQLFGAEIFNAGDEQLLSGMVALDPNQRLDCNSALERCIG